ncbi:MAG: carbohydrate binding domain-containing protein [Lentisphaeria bacterium]|nr:carbohydrate binding domain-containing protein [Lentisphaeria bacterium]
MTVAMTLSAANLLRNPGFEEGLDGWQIWGGAPADPAARARVLSISTDAASGKQALRITDEFPEHFLYAVQRIRLEKADPETCYRLSFFAKAAAGAVFSAGVHVEKPSAENAAQTVHVTGMTSSGFVGSGQWQKYQYEFTGVTASASVLMVCFWPCDSRLGAAATGTLLLDDVVCEEIAADGDDNAPLQAPQTYHVSPAGDDRGDGSAEAPWRSIGRANEGLRPGDTALFHAGDYDGCISPFRSGRPSAPISYRAAGDGEVRLRGGAPRHCPDLWCIAMMKRRHVVIDGFSALDTGATRWLSLEGVEDCSFSNLSFSGVSTQNPVILRSIRHCRFADMVVERACGTRNGLVSGDMWNNWDAHYNVFERLYLSRAGHRPFGLNEGCSYNVVRDCVFDGRWGRNFEFFATSRTLMERCVITHAYEGSGSADPRAKWFGTDCVFRYNVLIRNYGAPLVANSYYDRWHKVQLALINSRMYNNTFVQNDECAWALSDERRKDCEEHFMRDNRHWNNIFFANDAAGCGLAIAMNQLVDDSNTFSHNLLCGSEPGGKVVQITGKGGAMWSVAEAEAAAPAKFRDNMDAAPRFVALAAGDVRPAADSVVIDAGVPLATVVADSDGDVLRVSDARPFYDGYGIPGETGDELMIGPAKSPARVVRADLVAGVLQLDRAVTARRGDGVSLPYAGAAPDLGAYEFGMDFAPGPRRLLDLPRVPALDERHPSPVISCDFEPETFEEWGYLFKYTRYWHSTVFLDTTQGAYGKSRQCLTAIAAPASAGELGRFGGLAKVLADREPARPMEGSLCIQIRPMKWDVDLYPILQFDYKITPGAPWGVAVNLFPRPDLSATWLFLCTTPGHDTHGIANAQAGELVNDGQWHTAILDMRLLRRCDPAFKSPSRIRFRNTGDQYMYKGAAMSNAQAWIDNVVIRAE